MPSEKVLQTKKEIVAGLEEKLNKAVAGVVVDYKGISVADDTKLRKELREAGVEYKVVKNTLLRFAAQNGGLADICPHLEGTTALAVSNTDVVAPAKILGKFAEASKGKFVIKTGFMEGKAMSADEVMALSKLPSKEQLLCMLLSALNGNIRGLAVALNAIAEKEPA
ncbi:MAG: 50S ribosomal protein L10 [Hydrogenoanaerobacterium sp.]